MKGWLVIYAVLVLSGIYRETAALNNGVARTPPSETHPNTHNSDLAVNNLIYSIILVGWVSWERFACNTDCTNDPQNCIRWVWLTSYNDHVLLSSEQLFLDMAKKLVDLGFKDLGYEFVNIDVSNDSQNTHTI